MSAVLIVYRKYVGSWGSMPKVTIVDKLGEKLIERVSL